MTEPRWTADRQQAFVLWQYPLGNASIHTYTQKSRRKGRTKYGMWRSRRGNEEKRRRKEWKDYSTEWDLAKTRMSQRGEWETMKRGDERRRGGKKFTGWCINRPTIHVWNLWWSLSISLSLLHFHAVSVFSSLPEKERKRISLIYSNAYIPFKKQTNALSLNNMPRQATQIYSIPVPGIRSQAPLSNWCCRIVLCQMHSAFSPLKLYICEPVLLKMSQVH